MNKLGRFKWDKSSTKLRDLNNMWNIRNSLIFRNKVQWQLLETRVTKGPGETKKRLSENTYLHSEE